MMVESGRCGVFGCSSQVRARTSSPKKSHHLGALDHSLRLFFFKTVALGRRRAGSSINASCWDYCSPRRATARLPKDEDP